MRLVASGRIPPLLGLLGIGLMALLARPRLAAATRPENYDVASLPAPITPSPFASLETASSLGERVLGAGARFSFLERPLTLGLPAAAPEGTTTSGVERLVLGEVLLAGGLTRHFDVGFGLPLRLFQEGFGLEAVGGREGVRSPALGDPRIFLAHALPLFDAVRLRAYGTLFLPLATRNAFAGGDAPRGVVGLTASYGDESRVGVDVSGRFEEATNLGATTLGSHLRLGLGFSQKFAESFRIGLEASGAVLFATGEPRVEGRSPVVVPLEILTHLRRALPFGEVAVLGGFGVPAGLSSELTGSRPLLAPGTPVFRLGFEFRVRIPSEERPPN